MPLRCRRPLAAARQLGRQTLSYDYHWRRHRIHGTARCYELIAALRPAAEAHRLHGIGPFNLGTADNFRVPDYGYYRVGAGLVLVESLAEVQALQHELGR